MIISAPILVTMKKSWSFVVTRTFQQLMNVKKPEKKRKGNKKLKKSVKYITVYPLRYSMFILQQLQLLFLFTWPQQNYPQVSLFLSCSYAFTEYHHLNTNSADLTLRIHNDHFTNKLITLLYIQQGKEIQGAPNFQMNSNVSSWVLQNTWHTVESLELLVHLSPCEMSVEILSFCVAGLTYGESSYKSDGWVWHDTVGEKRLNDVFGKGQAHDGVGCGSGK